MYVILNFVKQEQQENGDNKEEEAAAAQGEADVAEQPDDVFIHEN